MIRNQQIIFRTDKRKSFILNKQDNLEIKDKIHCPIFFEIRANSLSKYFFLKTI